jgi:hypothetical protein
MLQVGATGEEEAKRMIYPEDGSSFLRDVVTSMPH